MSSWLIEQADAKELMETAKSLGVSTLVVKQAIKNSEK